jgi:hypothetical protein
MPKTIPKRDFDFNEVQHVITTKTVPNLNNWRIDAAWYNQQIVPAKTVWTTAWTAYLNPNTRTPVITFQKTAARKKYESLLRKLVGMLKASPFVTPSDLAALGIVTRKSSGGRNPVPETYPDAIVDISMIRQLTIDYFDFASKSHAKPHGVHGAEIRWEILHAAPVHIDELRNSSFDTRSPFTLTFNENERGQTVYFCLRWENTTGEKGPWSEIRRGIIP